MDKYPLFAEWDKVGPLPDLLDELCAAVPRKSLEARIAFAAQEGIPIEDVDVVIEPSENGNSIRIRPCRIQRGVSPIVITIHGVGPVGPYAVRATCRTGKRVDTGRTQSTSSIRTGGSS